VNLRALLESKIGRNDREIYVTTITRFYASKLDLAGRSLAESQRSTIEKAENKGARAQKRNAARCFAINELFGNLSLIYPYRSIG